MEYIRIAVCFTAGIYLYERVNPWFALIFMLSLIMVLTIQLIFKHKINIKIFIFALAFIAGNVYCNYALSADTRDLSPYEGRYVTLVGRVAEIPWAEAENVHCTVDVRYLTHKGETIKIKDRVLLTAPDSIEYGDTITFSGLVNSLPPVMNSGGFDYARYYKSNGLFFKMYSESVQLCADKIRDYSPLAINTGLKNYISKIIDANYSGDYAAVMKAVLTGNKHEFSEDYDRVLTRTGTKRYFYPSFLHVMLFMSLISVVLGAFGRRKRDYLTVFLLIIFALANSSNTVLLKQSLLLACVIAVKAFTGRMYYLDMIGVTALILETVNPLICFNSAFAVSMLSSVMIYYFYDTVYKRFKFIRFKYLRRSVTIGTVCMVCLLPVSAYFFNELSVYSLLVSVMMLPCTSIILILSPILIPMLALFHTAPLIQQAVRAVLFIIVRIPVVLDKISILICIPEPSVLCLIIYVLTVAAAVKKIKNKKRDMLVCIFAAAAFTVSAACTQLARINDVDITFVNVGQGDGAVINVPYRFTVLIDGGGGNAYSDYNPGEKIYLEYLKRKGITKVDSAFVSHYHKDHVQGIAAAIENIRVKNLFLPDNMEGSEWRTELERAANENGTRIYYISEETMLTYKNGMTICVIPPTQKTMISDDENDTSNLIYVSYGDFTAAFTGDMSSYAERCVIESGKAENVDLLKAAHHGSKSSTCEEWVRALSPRYAVISVGEGNTYALPDRETLDKLAGAEVYRTDTDGDICFTVEKNGKIKINTLNGR